MLNIPKEVKELFEKDSVRKNVRIHFPNGERADITNSNLIAESFSFTESVMSQSEFRFGLCEASMVEFECFGVENIKDYEIKVFHEIDISSLGEEFIAEYGMTSEDVAFPYYRVPYGKFKVDEALRQADMVRRKITAYSKEADWKNIPNPVERAKAESLYCKYNSPYKFNLSALVYANAYNGDYEYLTDKTLITPMSGASSMKTLNRFITLKSKNVDSSYEYYFYELTVSAKPTRYKISVDDSIDTLYWLNNSKPIEINNVIEILRNILYGGSYNFDLTSENVMLELFNKIEYGTCNMPTYDEISDDYAVRPIGLNSNKYIYPFMNYTSNEKTKIKNSNIYSSSPNIEVYQNVRITIKKLYTNNINAIYGSAEETVFQETFDLRSAEEINCYKINNLPAIYMSVNRNKIYGKYGSEYSPMYILQKDELNIRDIIQSYAEFNGLFGKYDRYGNFKTISLSNNLGLYPSEDLYPSETLYPREASGGILTKGNYLSAWYDDEYTKPYDRVSVSYKNTDEEEMYAEYLLVDIESDTYNASDYQAYSLSENILIQNGTFTEAQITGILQTVGESLRNIRYMPCEIDAVGMPWVEAGDGLEIVTKNGAFDTLVLNRRINGIQRLIDNIEAD